MTLLLDCDMFFPFISLFILLEEVEIRAKPCGVFESFKSASIGDLFRFMILLSKFALQVGDFLTLLLILFVSILRALSTFSSFPLRLSGCIYVFFFMLRL